MNKKQKLLGYYNYTVVLTYIGMLTGFSGILSTFNGKPFRAVLCLMIAGFCDMFDGTIASTRIRTEQEKCFGIQIDSLSDLICFGVLPGLIVYSLNPGSRWVSAIAGLYALCALIRLAYFNVDEQERQKNSTGCRELYYGMPVTLSALLLPVAYSIETLLARSADGVMVGLLLLMAVLFVLPFPLRKPKQAGKLCILLCGVAEVFLVVFAGAGAR